MSELAEKRGPKAWGEKERKEWLARQTVKRSYERDVVRRLKRLSPLKFDVGQYGDVKGKGNKSYPLYRVQSQNWNPNNPTILITGGVHGYERSGVMGALHFLEKEAHKYEGKVNFVVYPCISPFAYEIDHRWNANADDPNRNFVENSTVRESALFMESLEKVKAELLPNKRFAFALDLHETNNRDIKLRQERDARDDSPPRSHDDIIPQGFYLCVGSKDHISIGQRIVEAVRRVTKICNDPTIIGYRNHNGVIVTDDISVLMQNFVGKHADYAMTTEINPDSISRLGIFSRRKSNRAQVAAIRGAINFVLEKVTNG